MRVRIDSRFFVFLGALGLLLCGCGSMKPLPSDTFYRLNVHPVSPDTAAPWSAETVRVAKFAASGVHRERAIAYSHTDEVVVKQHRYHLWIDSPERMLQNELVSYLRSASVAPLVTGSKIDGNRLEVRGRIDRMDMVVEPDTPGITVELHIEVVERGGGERLVLGREYRESRALDNDDMGAIASAMSDAVAAIFAQFTADAGEALRGDTNVSNRFED